MKIEKIKISDIKPYENNAKLHPPEQIEQIKKSILEFGNNDPIAIDENGVIIEGHGRYIALKELKFTEIDVIKLNHLTDEQKCAYALIHNKLTINTGFDFNILDSELAYINSIDIQNFGFEINEINDEDFDTDFKLNDEDRSELEQMTFVLHKNQAKFIRETLEISNNKEFEEFDNPNKSGNILYEIAKEWLEMRTQDED